RMLSFFFSSRSRHTRCLSDWSSDVCSSDLAHAPTCPKAIADVREVLHHDRGRANASGFLENRLARFVIDVFDAPPFLAGDLPESLNRTLAAVGLQATTQSQMLITPMAQCLSAPDPARAGCGESIFP